MLVAFLRENSDVFAWEASGLPGIPREVIEHKLAVNTDTRPVKQVLWKQIDLSSFPAVEEALRVTDEFCEQYRILRREVEILQE